MEVYEAPALRHFGSVAALTASSVKCSLGTDAAFGDAGRKYTEALGDIWVADDGSGHTIDPNKYDCTRTGDLAPL